MAVANGLPRLVAHVAGEGVRAYLLGVAKSGGTTHLALASPPSSGALHLLEVHTAGDAAPLHLHAEPLGPPNEIGWPLRLTVSTPPWRDTPDFEEAPSLRLSLPVPAAATNVAVPEMSPAPPPLSTEEFDWVERAHLGSTPSTPPEPLDARPASTSWPAPPPGAARPSSRPDAEASAVAPFLRQLADTTDRDRFAVLVAPVGARIRSLVEQGNTATAWRFCSTFELIAAEAPGPGSRADLAKTMLEIFREPQLLTPLAERILDGKDPEGWAQRFVVRAGKRGARALYQARLSRGAPEMRERFVTVLGSIGASSLRMFKSAFEVLEARLGIPGAVDITFDLMRAVPNAPDESVGRLIARYMRSPHVALAAAATEALPRVWRDKARPALAEQIARPEPAVAVAAMKQLRGLGGISTPDIQRLRDVVAGARPVHPAMRLAAIETVAAASLDARPLAQALLADALSRAVGPSPDVDDLVVMISWALLTVGGQPAPVAARWRASSGALRDRLEELLRRAATTSRS